MKILVSGDLANLIKSLENLSLDDRLLPFNMKIEKQENSL